MFFGIIDFVLLVFNKCVEILNTRFFSDVDITFLELILGAIAIKFVIHFITGGFKEVDKSSNFFIPHIAGNAKGMSNDSRKKQIVDNRNSGMVDVWGDGTYLVPKSKYYGE